MFQKLYKRLQKILLIGPKATYAVFKNKIIKKRYEKELRSKNVDFFSHYSWRALEKTHKMSCAIDTFIESYRLKSLFPVRDYFAENSNKNSLIKQADFFINGGLDILGSEKQVFSKMPWHQDIRVKKDGTQQFDPHAFFADIKISVGKTWDLDRDIKLPWEISRCQHISYVAYAYAQTNDERYAQYVVATIRDWIHQNQYPYGVNWCNPMEVALRAINWIVALEMCKRSDTMNQSDWEHIIASLYTHFVHLEHTWEFYDGRTCNHYLANLVGYLYLCRFFQRLFDCDKKIARCIKELLQEFDKQIFQEGTSYEGSTAYHGLVTELFCHAFLLSNNLGHAWTDQAEQKLLRMLEFMRWCTPQEGVLITIGDNDSGHVLLHGLSESVIALIKKTIALPLSSLNNEVKIYPEFGVAIINTKQVHCSLRAPSYNPLQPSGHFHADALSMTLAIDGHAVFVDPGSYVYTPSALWRNYFRSMKVHNAFMITNKEPIPLSEDLFSASVPSGRSCIKQNGYSIYSSHDWYAYVGFRAYRKIIYLKDQKKIIITDWWESINNKATSDVLNTTWNFILDAQLHVSQDDSAYSIVKNGTLLARVSSPDLVFKSVPAWVSPAYGQKYAAYALSAQKIISPHTFITTTIDIV